MRSSHDPGKVFKFRTALRILQRVMRAAPGGQSWVLASSSLLAVVAAATSFGAFYYSAYANQRLRLFGFLQEKAKGKERKEDDGQAPGMERATVVGLENTGNSCFLNVILQALASSSAIVAFLEASFQMNSISAAEGSPSSCQVSHWESDKAARPLAAALLQILTEIARPVAQHRVASPRKLIRAMACQVSRFDLASQQDSLEALTLLTSAIDDESIKWRMELTSPSMQTSASWVGSCHLAGLKKLSLQAEAVQSPGIALGRHGSLSESETAEKDRWPLTGTLCSLLECQQCGHQFTVQLYSTTELSLVPAVSGSGPFIKQPCSVVGCLANFTAPEEIAAVECSRCCHLATLGFLKAKLAKATICAFGPNNLQRSLVSGLEAAVQMLEQCPSGDDCGCSLSVKALGEPWVRALSRASKRLLIGRSPQVLCLQIQRLALSPAGSLHKLQGFVAFPLVLSLSQFALATQAATLARRQVATYQPNSASNGPVISDKEQAVGVTAVPIGGASSCEGADEEMGLNSTTCELREGAVQLAGGLCCKGGDSGLAPFGLQRCQAKQELAAAQEAAGSCPCEPNAAPGGRASAYPSAAFDLAEAAKDVEQAKRSDKPAPKQEGHREEMQAGKDSGIGRGNKWDDLQQLFLAACQLCPLPAPPGQSDPRWGTISDVQIGSASTSGAEVFQSLPRPRNILSSTSSTENPCEFAVDREEALRLVNSSAGTGRSDSLCPGRSSQAEKGDFLPSLAASEARKSFDGKGILLCNDSIAAMAGTRTGLQAESSGSRQREYELVAVVVHHGGSKGGHYSVMRRLRLQLPAVCMTSQSDGRRGQGKECYAVQAREAVIESNEKINCGNDAEGGVEEQWQDEGHRVDKHKQQAAGGIAGITMPSDWPDKMQSQPGKRGLDVDEAQGQGLSELKGWAASAAQPKAEMNVEMSSPQSKDLWFDVSDSHVCQVSVAEVLSVEASLLFYECVEVAS